MAYTFYIAKPAVRPAWQALFYVYSPLVWILFSIAIVIVGSLLLLLDKKNSLWQIVAWLIFTITGKGLGVPRRDIKTGLIIFTWSLSSIFICYIFMSFLISSLTRPVFEKTIETWQELIDHNYVIQTPLAFVDGKWKGNNTLFDLHARVRQSQLFFILNIIFILFRNQA